MSDSNSDYSYYSESGQEETGEYSYSYSSTSGGSDDKKSAPTGDTSDSSGYSYEYSESTADKGDEDDVSSYSYSSTSDGKSGSASAKKDESGSDSYYSYSESAADSGKSDSPSYSYSYSSTDDGDKKSSKSDSKSKSSKSKSKDKESSDYSYSYSYSESAPTDKSSDASYSYSYTSTDDEPKSKSKSSKSDSRSKSKSKDKESSDYSYSYSYSESQPDGKDSSDASYSYSYTSTDDAPKSKSKDSRSKSKSSKSKSKHDSTGSYSYSYTPSSSGGKVENDDDYSYSYYYSGDDSKGEGDEYSYSDYSDYYSYDQTESSEYLSEFTRERLNPPLKDWFSDLPEPTMEFRIRKTQDVYFRRIQQNIKRLKDHICRIQAEEEAVIVDYCDVLTAEDDPTDDAEKVKPKESERNRIAFLERLAGVRKQRKAYRSLLYDAITQRNNMIESAEIRYEEERAKDLALWSLGRHREVDYFLFFLFTLQMICMLLYIVFVEFEQTSSALLAEQRMVAENVLTHYASLRNISLIVFAGFGFLLTFVRKFSFTSLSYGFLTAAFTVQWIVLWLGLFGEAAWQRVRGTGYNFAKTPIGIPQLTMGLYGASAVMISFGSLAGRLDPIQYAIMAVVESFFWCVNVLAMFQNQPLASQAEVVDDPTMMGTAPPVEVTEGDFSPKFLFGEFMGRVDPGGANMIHIFGSVFGLAVSLVAARLPRDDKREEKTTYENTMYGWFGSMMLFALFPAFNSAFAYPGTQYRMLWHTVLAMGGSAMSTFMVGKVLIGSGNLLNSFQLQRAILVGAISVATPLTYFTPPIAALFLGMVTGILSLACIHFIPTLLRACRIHDTAAVFGAHLVPGLFASLASIIVVASPNVCEDPDACMSMQKSFTVGGQTYTTPSLFDVHPSSIFPGISLEEQATKQFVILVASLALGLVGGLFTGIVLVLFNWCFKVRPEERKQYQDDTYFHVPTSGYIWNGPASYD